MDNLTKKILIKIFIILFFIMLFVMICISFENKDNSEINSTFFSSDARMEANIENYYMRNIEMFFSSVKEKKYELAFELLSDTCKKEVYLNSQSNFQTKMEEIFDTSISEKKITYEKFSKENKKENGKNIYVVEGTISFENFNVDFKGDIDSDEVQNFLKDRHFKFRIKENSPFDYEYYLYLN